MSEKSLVLDYRHTYDALEQANLAWDKANEAHQIAKAKLIEDLEVRNATATAKYDGIGRVSLQKPELFASCKKEFQVDLYSYLRDIGRQDLMKETVHHKTLTSFAVEMTEKGEPLPEFITLSFKKVARLTK